MAEKRKLEFIVLRYMPDAAKGEFVNFGVLTLQDGVAGAELVDARFARDWDRVLCLDPQADVDVLVALQKEIQQEVGRKKDELTLLKRMEDSFSGVVQVSLLMPVLTEKMAAVEIGDVAKALLETVKVRRTREPAGRQMILETMRSEFERAGVLTLLHAVPVEEYTKAGDPFRFDFGYRVANEIKLFQAVSMKASVDSAVMLAARYPKIAPRMVEIAKAAPLLTAVIDDGLDRSRSDVGFALEMMDESNIRLASAGEMRGIAELARKELGA